MKIVPAILESSFEEIKNKMAQVNRLVPVVQIDVCDGLFTETKTWPFWSRNEYQFEKLADEKEGMPFWDTLDIEWDLMVKMPKHIIGNIIRIGAKRIIIHATSVVDPVAFLDGLDGYARDNIEWGIALMPDVDMVEKYKDAILAYDFVQIMGIEHVGVQGARLSEHVFDAISAVRAISPEKVISIDGGVTLKNAATLKDAGVSRLVAGSSVFKSGNIEDTIHAFRQI